MGQIPCSTERISCIEHEFPNHQQIQQSKLPAESILKQQQQQPFWSQSRSTCVSRHLSIQNGRISLEQGFTVCMLLPMTTSAFGLRRRRVPLNCFTYTFSVLALKLVTILTFSILHKLSQRQSTLNTKEKKKSQYEL